jgi:hypothetical protein
LTELAKGRRSQKSGCRPSITAQRSIRVVDNVKPKAGWGRIATFVPPSAMFMGADFPQTDVEAA